MNKQQIIQHSRNIVHDVFVNLQNRVKTKKHEQFLEQEGQNVVFLMSRALHLDKTYEKMFKDDMNYLLSQNIFPLEEPKILLSLEEGKFEKPQAIVAGYDEEFPQDILNGNWVIATRVMVAQALAYWSFYHKEESKLSEVVNVSLERVFAKKLPKLTFASSKILKPNSEGLIYFVTHIVLIATMWGEIIKPVGGKKSQWIAIIEMLQDWVLELDKYAKKNLEIWLELLFCLNLLKQFKFTEQFRTETFTLFSTDYSISKQHTAYHTYILWILYVISIPQKT